MSKPSHLEGQWLCDGAYECFAIANTTLTLPLIASAHPISDEYSIH